MIGVVLAAGAGVRMRPLSDERIKPLLPLLGVPMVGWGVARLAEAGCERVWVNSNRDPEGVEEAAERAGRGYRLQILISHEPGEPLGTAGALGKIAPNLDETFLVANSDVVADAPLPALIAAHRSGGGVATLLVIPVDGHADFAVEEGWVAELIDRNLTDQPGHRYCGIGVFEPEVLDCIPDGTSGLFETVMAGAMAEKSGLATFEWGGYYRDVGTPEAHLRANLDALAGAFDHREIPRALATPARWDASAFVAGGAEVSEVGLRHVVVGSNAFIEPGSRLERCVVWEEVRVTSGSYRDSILTSRGAFRPRGNLR